jgi:2-dehydro-3-deoxygalactonokinase
MGMDWTEGFIAVDFAAIGRPHLTRLFAAALPVAGRPARAVDGEAAFLAGARHLAELVR